jgi:hypothetical protein
MDAISFIYSTEKFLAFGNFPSIIWYILDHVVLYALEISVIDMPFINKL